MSKTKTNIIALLILCIFVFVSPYLLALLLVLMVVVELLALRNDRLPSFNKNTYIYLLPVAYALNLGIHYSEVDSIIIGNAVVAIVIAAIALVYIRARTGTMWTPIIIANLPAKHEQPHNAKTVKDVLYTYKSLFWHYIFLVAVAVNLFFPALSLVLFVIVAASMLFKIVVLLRNRGQVNERTTSRLRTIEQYGPKFVIFFSLGKPATDAYMMWDKYFKKVGEPFIVITPQEKHIRLLKKETDTPVVYCKNARDMEDILNIKSIKAVFYPTNSGRNMDAMISTYPLHVHIGHGDSDKAPSYRSVTAMYDKIFVAGQEGIDRYENHGVFIPKDKFMIVGRPQVEDVKVKSGARVKTILYAPTWHGDVEEFDYTSLYKGREIVKSLLSAGLRVVFRPHQNSRLSTKLSLIIDDIYRILAEDKSHTGTDHIYGDRAEQKMSIIDCINESDALVSDVSSVTSDYLYSEKPIILIAMKDLKEKFVKNNPVARAAYVITGDLAGFDSVVKDLIDGNDKLAEKRESLKVSYLSKPKKNKSYVSLFVDGVKQVLDMNNPRRNKT